MNSGRLVHVTWGNFIFVVCFKDNGLEVDVFRVVVIWGYKIISAGEDHSSMRFI